ncbi:MAG: hypothetical protein ACAI18_07990 [Gemmatimonadales bacterium]
MNAYSLLLGALALCSTLVLTGCGGSDGGTGPGGGGIGGQYELVGINEDALPESEVIENCSETVFYSGSLSLDNDSFEMRVEKDDLDGEDWFGDHGTFERDGNDLHFRSEAWGDEFEGEVEGSLVVLYYDYCANGVADVDLVFE